MYTMYALKPLPDTHMQANEKHACLIAAFCGLWWEKNGSEALELGVLEGFLGVTTQGV